MYTLMNGKQVEELHYCATGVETWEQSQYFWYHGQKVCIMYNGETGENWMIDANGGKVLFFD